MEVRIGVFVFPDPGGVGAERWPLFDVAGELLHLQADKVSVQRSGPEGHGARPVRAARGGLHGGGEAGCERSGAAAAAAAVRWPLRWPKQRLRRRQEAGEGSGAGLRTGRGGRYG